MCPRHLIWSLSFFVFALCTPILKKRSSAAVRATAWFGSASGRFFGFSASRDTPQKLQRAAGPDVLLTVEQALHVQSEANGPASGAGPFSGMEQTSHVSRAPLLTNVHALHAQLENSGSGPVLAKWRSRGSSQAEQARSPRYWPSTSVFT